MSNNVAQSQLNYQNEKGNLRDKSIAKQPLSNFRKSGSPLLLSPHDPRSLPEIHLQFLIDYSLPLACSQEAESLQI